MMLKIMSFALVLASAIPILFTSSGTKAVPMHSDRITVCYEHKGCVFRTLFGEEPSDSNFVNHTPEKALHAVDQGLEWLASAQLPNGGWGAGSHQRQDIIDPHAVPADPATTAMVGMALMRSGVSLKGDKYSGKLKDALEYLLETVESTPTNRPQITDQQGTQIQSKLGNNIDAVMAIQFFTNILDELEEGSETHKRVNRSLDICVSKVQQLQDADGSFRGSGWAGVLQSGLATSALEAAQAKGADVDEAVFERSKEYQKNNYNPETKQVNTDKGAGIVLYSVSGSVRASAKDARKVKEDIKKAKNEGKLKDSEKVTVESLMVIGYSRDEAVKYNTSYQVYESSKTVAQADDVMRGFGNNGGEEFLSYLQTGESLIINQDQEWKRWYSDISGRLISIQNEDGSWNGHHCITSPVFCTATTLLTLSIQNDMDKLVELGGRN